MEPEFSPKVQVQIDAIKSLLANFKSGALIDEIEKALPSPIPRRTLQRRLSQMKSHDYLQITGEGKATRYHLEVEAKKEKEIEVEPGTAIPLCNEGKLLLKGISRPVSERNPVGYHREFLELYEPNVTNYLSQEEKKILHQQGKVAVYDQIAGTYSGEILQRLLIDLSYNSSRLEGNTYSLLDTQGLINLGEVATNKPAIETQMILNHKDAIEFISRTSEYIGINRYTILNLHALLSNNLLPNPAASGRLRTNVVGIEGSVYTPLAIPQLIEEMFELILNKAGKILDPFEQAFFLMVHLPYLQSFEDVNKRVSRLAANLSLIHQNLAPLSFVDVPADLYLRSQLAVYELNRTELLKDLFLWAYQRSAARYSIVRQSIGEPDPFRLKFRQQIRKLVTEVISMQLNKKDASIYLENNSIEIPGQDRHKFIEYVETELLSLHEGNFARYMISPAEFKKWKIVWGD